MKKKILIGSIVAVVILVLVSFTGVVGYQTTTSSTIARASPLFNIRTSRAIDEENKNTLKTNYIGKQNKVVIPFLIPTRATMIKTIIERIKEIDDSTFNQLLLYVIYESDTDFTESGKLPQEILWAIQIIREETDNNVAQDNPEPLTFACQTLDCQTAYRCETVFKGCITYKIFTALIGVLNNVYVVTENIPLFKGNMILLLIEVLASLYEMYTTTLPPVNTALQTD
jgi:hypothetical protein